MEPIQKMQPFWQLIRDTYSSVKSAQSPVCQPILKLDPVGSTGRYEVMQLIIDVTGSVEGIYALYILNRVEIWTGVTDP